MRRLGWTLGALAMSAGAAVTMMFGTRPAEAISGEIFVMTGTAKFLHFHDTVKAGKAAFVNNAGGSLITKAIKNPLVHTAGFLEQSDGGKSYLRFTSLTQWDMALDKTFAGDVMTMNGFVDGRGSFMFTGVHAKSGTTFVAKGIVVFKTGTLKPVSISGQIWGVSSLTQHFASGTLKSVGKAVQP